MNKINRRKTVVVGLSGGVDSSVTAAMLKKQGFNVIGVYMKNWSQDFGDYGCTWVEDSEDARKVAQVLDIPFYIWDFEKEYYDKVVDYFLREYSLGRTPNPDVMCNSEIKFKVFLDRALNLGADFVATGHYAQIRYQKSDNSYHLLKGIDPTKDQSYFLYTLNQKQLSRIMFPLGNLPKTQVRILAKKFKLPNATKKDSQGICFIGKINVTEFLKAHVKAKAGQIITSTGQILGKHDGLPYYTIGQREGMNLGGKGPYYVVSKNFKSNQLVVTNDKQDSGLWKNKFTITDLSWVGKVPKLPLHTGVTIRYHHPDYPAVIDQISDNRYQIAFKQVQRAITAGQAAVFYDGEELLGGGIIDTIL
ncbi:MAG: tRNA 2-thiouridine(34) synthase MnmA [Candidatus Doudnabacteria bacterium]|nr:tRNA 2-thiouridine(34) synthase MnmA [Candidatus Doudnabacteria bacterium]